MSDQPKLSVEETANELYHYDEDKDGWQCVIKERTAFIAGHTHATNDANLVPLEKVIKLLRDSGLWVGKKGISIEDLITQIKNLKE